MRYCTGPLVDVPVPAPSPPLSRCGAVTGMLAFDAVDTDLNRDVFIALGDGSAPVRVTDHASREHQPALSPDAQQLLFTSHRTGTPQVYLMDLATREARALTDRGDGADQPSFSHDGKRAAFHSGTPIYWLDLESSEEHLVASGLDSYNAYFWPRFSADDGQLFFDRVNEINRVKLDGTELRPVVYNTTALMSAPIAGPNGTTIAYQANCYWKPAPSIWLTAFEYAAFFCEGRLVAENAEHPAWGAVGPVFLLGRGWWRGPGPRAPRPAGRAGARSLPESHRSPPIRAAARIWEGPRAQPQASTRGVGITPTEDKTKTAALLGTAALWS